MRTFITKMTFGLVTALALTSVSGTVPAMSAPDPVDQPTAIGPSVAQVSVPVRDLPTPSAQAPGTAHPRINPQPQRRGDAGPSNRVRPRAPKSTRAAQGNSPAPNLVFDGTGNPLGCAGCSPPDTTGDVGPNNYIQMVNATKVAIFDKAGVLQKPAFNLSTLFNTGVCSTSDAGDPQVVYDPLADRWVLSQFQSSPDTLCFAVSMTPDPLGSYHLYSFPMTQFPDYFKVGVWPSGYYVSTNESTYVAYAFDRAKMLLGQPATAIRVPGQTNFMLPADVDGTAAPSAAGGLFYTFKDNAFHSVASDRLEMFELTPDFTTPANTTFTTIATIPIKPFTYTVCGFFNLNCIPQGGTGQKVDPVSEWPMQRFAYRRFAGRETLVGNFTVGGGSGPAGAAIRWFELDNTGSGWSLGQEGTHDPGDGLDRWMGSIAMDGNGNIALGYSASSTTAFPSLRYATRTPTDPPGTLQAEQVMKPGGGSQTGSNRWGDYTAMSVDPANERAFWYTGQYYATSSATDWSTAIGSFTVFWPQVISFPQPPDASLAAGPVTLSATGGGSGNPVVFTSATPAVCTTGGPNGATVTLAKPGACTISADQAGNAAFLAAAQVQRVFQVAATTPIKQRPLDKCVVVPRQIPLRGKTKLMQKRCVTNAGQKVRVKVTGSVTGSRRSGGDVRYWKVIRKANGAVFLQTRGYTLRLRIQWSAPAVGNYLAYTRTEKYRTRK